MNLEKALKIADSASAYAMDKREALIVLAREVRALQEENKKILSALEDMVAVYEVEAKANDDSNWRLQPELLKARNILSKSGKLN